MKKPPLRWLFHLWAKVVRMRTPVPGSRSIAKRCDAAGHPALLRMRDKRQRGYRAMGYRIDAGAGRVEQLF